jgi:hypothetical protein
MPPFEEGHFMKQKRNLIGRLFGVLVALGVAQHGVSAADTGPTYASHAPMRPLPVASKRLMSAGPSYFVDPSKGTDVGPGSVDHPWKTVNAAIGHLKPGDTLYLRGGTYYEMVAIRSIGTQAAPITIRSYPGELAIVDAGYPEFYKDPANAWEPVPGGAPDEYQSKKTYTAGGGSGLFGDSMIPFQRYMTLDDLRSTNELYRPELENRSDDKTGIYAGPGVKRDADTGKIHIRLAHTTLAGLGDNAYMGETDPRKLSLVIANSENALDIESAQNIIVQDLVFRGGARDTVRIENCANITLDGVTIYGNYSAMIVGKTDGFHVYNSALRGIAAPWHSRFVHKDRSKSGYLFAGNGENFEFANCELTDNHDGLQLYGIDGLLIHNCVIGNFNDDGIEPGIRKAHGRTLVYCNYISRLLSPFTAHGKTPVPVVADEGSGMYVFRNVIDLREGTYEVPPTTPDPTGAYLHKPAVTIIHDHGSPLQDDYYVYQNTFLMQNGVFRNVYALSWACRTAQSIRRVFNNICVQVNGMPGTSFVVAPQDDFQADGNLSWSVKDGPTFKGDLFAKFRASEMFKNSKAKYPAGWTSNDLFASPDFVSFNEDYHQPSDFRLKPGSPAIKAGVPLPGNWPDQYRGADAAKPDIGALPSNAEPWRVGVNGRYSASGQLIGQ